jgi:peptidoglycan hydrolase-like protein with peptidoglycan-binding domain
MHTTDYLHTDSAHRTSQSTETLPVGVKFNLFASLNWKKLTTTALMPLLSIALTLGILSIAEQTLALEKRGSRGPQVSNIQRCLTRLGYYNGPINGNFGPLTQNAVNQFQRANRLTVDGIVGNNTERLLESQCRSTVSGTSGSGVLREGSRGPAVTKLQQDLRRLELYNGPITGYFGSQTEQAVARFQGSVRIRPDGIAGARTLEAIRISLNQNNNPYGMGDGDNNLPYALNVGNSGSRVRELQQYLQRLGYFNNNITGYYGPVTKDAVASFQRDYRLTPNGIADTQTLGAIYSAAEGNQSVSCTSSGDICQGESSQRVSAVQQRLQELGFFNARISGYYGPATRDAVTQFQRYYNISPTGIVNFQTWQALRLDNPGNSTVWNPQREDRYVVVVPMRDNDTLYKVRQFAPQAVPAESRLGEYVNAGQFRDRDDAQKLTEWLRSRGLDARVEYF